MKAICKISHEQTNMEGGGFRRYEAGQEYEVDSPDPAYFDTNPPLSPFDKGGSEAGGFTKTKGGKK